MRECAQVQLKSNCFIAHHDAEPPEAKVQSLIARKERKRLLVVEQLQADHVGHVPAHKQGAGLGGQRLRVQAGV